MNSFCSLRSSVLTVLTCLVYLVMLSFYSYKLQDLSSYILFLFFFPQRKISSFLCHLEYLLPTLPFFAYFSSCSKTVLRNNVCPVLLYFPFPGIIFPPCSVTYLIAIWCYFIIFFFSFFFQSGFKIKGLSSFLLYFFSPRIMLLHSVVTCLNISQLV